MWEAIASNQRRSLVLVSTLGFVLLVLGGVIGTAISMQLDRPRGPGSGAELPFPYSTAVDRVLAERPPETSLADEIRDHRAGLFFGMAAAMTVWLLLWLTARVAGESVLLRSAKAFEIRKEDAPQLWNVVEEMSIAAGLPRPPRVFLIDDPGLNAFAVGQSADRAAVAVTAGLLKRLSRDELQGVVAHEIGHIRNQDARFMTLAAVMLGAVVLVAHVFLRGMFFGGGRQRGGRGGGQGAAVMFAVALLVAILAPLAARLLYLACSRRREYLADASAARFTRYPEGLAAALEKIAGQARGAADVNRALAPLYIISPLQERALFSWFSTHPPTAERVRILRSMSGAGYAAYQQAFERLRGAGARGIDPRTLAAADEAPIQSPAPEPPAKDAVARAKAVGNLLDRMLPLVVLPCPCGVKLKLPPGFTSETLSCPHCGRTHTVPRAQPSVPDAAISRQIQYQRRSTGWESFQCRCGRPIQLSPKFTASQVKCTGCGTRIEVIPA